MLRALACFFCVLLANAASAAPAGTDSFRVPVLCYHAVSNNDKGRFTVSPEVFDEQMRILYNEGYSVISLNGLVSWLRAIQRGEQVFIPPKPVVLTFDDNYASIWQNALPILKKYNFTACNFIYTRDVTAVQWANYRKLAGEALLFQSHTLNHVNLVKRLPGEDDRAWRRRIFGEIGGSREKIGAAVGVEPLYLAYPFGTWNRDVIRMLRVAGYTAGLSAFGGYVRATSSLDVLPRFTVFREYDLTVFRRIVAGNWVGSQDEPDFIEARDYNVSFE